MMNRTARVIVGLAFAASLLISSSALAQACLLQSAKGGGPTYRLQTPERWTHAGKGLLGVNTLYYLETDAVWDAGQVVSQLRAAGVDTIRFPGGELADNYDWERHALERPSEWPREAPNEAERRSRTDYREMLAHSREVGVKDIFFVVNVDGAFRASGDVDQNLLRYAKKAARWVKAVRDSGFRVQYWEIGNEPDLASGFPLTASEYARALKIFAREMRAVDSTISIGAAGPAGPKWVAFGDRVSPDTLQALRRPGPTTAELCGSLSHDACVEKMWERARATTTGSAWWPTILAEAHDSFDFAVIHRYSTWRITEDLPKSGLPLTNDIARLRVFLEQQKGTRVSIALTEWNTPSEKRRGAMSEISHLIEIAIQLGNNAVGGVDFALYWPMRLADKSFKPFLTMDGESTPIASFFAIASKLLPGADVAESLSPDGVYTLHIRTKTKNPSGLIVANPTATRSIVEMQEPATAAAQLTVDRLAGEPEGQAVRRTRCTDAILRGGKLKVEVPPRSIAAVTINSH
jgi:hypothetical protein